MVGQMKHVLAAALLAVAFAGAPAVAPVFAEDETKAQQAEDPVIAVVNGEKITRGEVEAELARLPAQYRSYPPNVLFDLLVSSLIDTKIVAAKAREEGLHNDEEVKARMRQIESQLLEREFMTRRLSDAITEERLQEQYKVYLKENPPKEEMHGRHILVETEQQAKEVIARIDKGEDFEELAKTLSKGPSRRNGGDLGFFTRQQMVPAFAEAAFALKQGTITREPVKTQFGWHVIQSVEMRTSEPPEFEAVRGELQSQLSQQIGGEIMDGLRKGAEIVRYNPDGSKVEAN